MHIIRHLAVAAAMFVAAIGAWAQPAAVATDSVSVAVGTVLGGTIGRIVGEFEQGGVALDRNTVAATAERAIRGLNTGITLEQAQEIVNGILASMKPMEGVDSFDTASQEQWLAEAAARPGASTTASGVVIETLNAGSGASPVTTDNVRVFYVGRLSDDTIFDATDDPVTFPVAELTPGLSEALTLMQPGGRYRVTIPSELAYGEEGIPGIIPGRAALQFIIELVEIVK
ncbi:MAG: FKBP-type peptidyl-prolyl cis-trans isomerase [Muribaculaceae bacterium]|nr:FKBP-type peptidyl-prolyl cis-trans isomerase [Muribaculaceae bacterium]